MTDKSLDDGWAKRVGKRAEKAKDLITNQIPQTIQDIGTLMEDCFHTVEDACNNMGEGVDELWKNCATFCNTTIRKIERVFGVDPSPQNLSEILDDFNEWREKISKTITNSKVYKALVNFCNTGIDLIKSIGKTDEDRAKAWGSFKAATNGLIDVIIEKTTGSLRAR